MKQKTREAKTTTFEAMRNFDSLLRGEISLRQYERTSARVVIENLAKSDQDEGDSAAGHSAEGEAPRT